MHLSLPPYLGHDVENNVDKIHEYLYQLLDVLEELSQESGAGGAPTDAQYIVAASDATLTQERVVTDSSTVQFDLGVAQQVLAHIVNSSVTNAKLAVMPQLTLKGNDTSGSAQPQDLTVTEVQTLLGIPVGIQTTGVKKTVDQTVTTPTDMTELSFSVVAGETYNIRFAVIAHNDTVPEDVGFASTYPDAVAAGSLGTV